MEELVINEVVESVAVGGCGAVACGGICGEN